MRLYTSELVKKYKARTVVNHVSIDVNQGEIVGLLGPNGAGKTTTFYMIVGLIKPNEGQIFLEDDNGQVAELTKEPVYRRAQMGVGYLAQEASVFRRLSVEDNIKAVLEMTDLKKDEQAARCEALIEEFRLQKVRKSLGIQLSGGERRRLYLLHILMGAPNVLLLDEPTNDLDIGTLTILEDYLDHFQGIVITVSHDRYFLDRVVRRIFAFEGGGAIRQYEGGYTDYQAACGERIAAEMEASGTASGQERGRGQKTGGASGAGTSDAAETTKDKNRGRQREKKLKFSYMEQKEWETIEDDIAALEEAIADLEQQMQDSARDYTALNGIIKEKEEKEALLEEKMDRWMYLNDLAEKIEAQAAAHK